IDLIFQALGHLRDQRVPHFLVVTGPNAPAVRAAVREHGINADVRVAGLVPFEELKRYLAASDVGLLPYADKAINRARWPIKLGDYLAAGLPVATCAVGEMGAFVQEWNVGVATGTTPEAFARGIIELLQLPDPHALRKRARQAAVEFSWAAMGARAEY